MQIESDIDRLVVEHFMYKGNDIGVEVARLPSRYRVTRIAAICPKGQVEEDDVISVLMEVLV